MAAQEENIDTGSKDRATVALVNQKVDTVLAIVTGLDKTTNAKLDGMRESLAVLSGLPERVTRLEEQVKTVVTEQGDMQSDRQRDGEWMRSQFPALLIALLALLAAIVVPLIA